MIAIGKRCDFWKRPRGVVLLRDESNDFLDIFHSSGHFSKFFCFLCFVFFVLMLL